jgi:hypothetical protein
MTCAMIWRSLRYGRIRNLPRNKVLRKRMDAAADKPQSRDFFRSVAVTTRTLLPRCHENP